MFDYYFFKQFFILESETQIKNYLIVCFLYERDRTFFFWKSWFFIFIFFNFRTFFFWYIFRTFFSLFNDHLYCQCNTAATTIFTAPSLIFSDKYLLSIKLMPLILPVNYSYSEPTLSKSRLTYHGFRKKCNLSNMAPIFDKSNFIQLSWIHHELVCWLIWRLLKFEKIKKAKTHIKIKKFKIQ